MSLKVDRHSVFKFKIHFLLTTLIKFEVFRRTFCFMKLTYTYAENLENIGKYEEKDGL